MSEEVNTPIVPDSPDRNFKADHAMVYLMLHHISSVVRDVVKDVAQYKGMRQRARAFENRFDELIEAAAGIDLYKLEPPSEIAKSYRDFCANIASTEHLRENNKRLAHNWRTAVESVEQIAAAYGLGKTATADDIIREIDARMQRMEAELAKKTAALDVLHAPIVVKGPEA